MPVFSSEVHLLNLLGDLSGKELKTNSKPYDLVSCFNPFCNYNSINYGNIFYLINPEDIKKEKCPLCKKHSLDLWHEIKDTVRSDSFSYHSLTEPLKFRPDKKQKIQMIFKSQYRLLKSKWVNSFAHSRALMLNQIGITKDTDKDLLIHLVNCSLDSMPKAYRKKLFKKFCKQVKRF